LLQVVGLKKVKANAMLESDYKHQIKDEIKQDIYIKKRLAKGKQTPNLIYVDTDKHCCIKTDIGSQTRNQNLTIEIKQQE
jgi:hypothetical protein